MYKYFLNILVLGTLTSFGCSKVYSGKCKDTHSLQIKTLFKGTNFEAVFQIPLAIYQQEVYFFPTQDNQALQFIPLNSYFPMALLNANFNSSNSLRPAIYFNNETMRNVLFFSTLKQHKFVSVCEINKNISTLLFGELDSVLLWGCVNLNESNQHEETLWFFVESYDNNVTAKTIINTTSGYFEKYKPWIMKQLEKVSSIPEADFDYYFQNEKHLYFKPPSNLQERAQCPKSTPPTVPESKPKQSRVRFIIYVIIVLGLVLLLKTLII